MTEVYVSTLYNTVSCKTKWKGYNSAVFPINKGIRKFIQPCGCPIHHPKVTILFKFLYHKHFPTRIVSPIVVSMALHAETMPSLKEASLKACLISCFGVRCVLSGHKLKVNKLTN